MNIRNVGNHPNVVQFLGTFTDVKTQYLVLEFCKKGSLKEYIMQEWEKLSDDNLLDMYKLFIY